MPSIGLEIREKIGFEVAWLLGQILGLAKCGYPECSIIVHPRIKWHIYLSPGSRLDTKVIFSNYVYSIFYCDAINNHRCCIKND